ncbi:hypothetical protein RAA17_08840 [Komagataeibacter rhaeticus]|nr:hypothetical protein [Komagataeibacter rhaeticus]
MAITPLEVAARRAGGGVGRTSCWKFWKVKGSATSSAIPARRNCR